MLDLSNIINKYTALLEVEESNTIRYQFESFMNEFLSLDESDLSEDLYEDFDYFINTLEDNNKNVQKKIIDIVQSGFIQKILTYKTNAREKELRRLTLDLSDFIESLGHERGTNRNRPQHQIAASLRMVAKDIEPRKQKGPKQSMNDAWRESLIAEMVKRFK